MQKLHTFVRSKKNNARYGFREEGRGFGAMNPKPGHGGHKPVRMEMAMTGSADLGFRASEFRVGSGVKEVGIRV